MTLRCRRCHEKKSVETEFDPNRKVCKACRREEAKGMGLVPVTDIDAATLEEAREIIVDLHVRVRTLWVGSIDYNTSELADRVRAFLRR